MNLLVDIGNSRIKWCRQRTSGNLDGLHATVYTQATLTACLDAQWRTLKQPEQIWVANVAGKSVAAKLNRWTRLRWGRKPHYAVVTKSAGGVRNAYPDISQLGIDRWLALIAAWRKYGSAACIVDCGTAVTIDGLDGRGRHMGGLILPGVTLMQQALYRAATGIPAIGKMQTGRGLADNTRQGVANGCTMAVVALIERTVAEIRKKARGKTRCMITGGGAGDIMPLLQADFVHEPRLVLEGLAAVAGGQT